MINRGAVIALLLLLTLGALCLRLPALDNRPFHGDEAVHAFKFLDVWKKGVYRYDPNEYHGPTIYYAALPAVALRHRHDFAATQEADYRLPIACFGAALVLLTGLLADALGRRAMLCAGLLTALSPAFVFYSRYYIQEVPLVFFTLGLLACGWRYTQSLRPGWLLAAGMCAGLMLASKETSILTFGAIVMAIGLTGVWTRRVTGRALNLRRLWNLKTFTLASLIGLLTACLFLSGFGSHLAGPLDFLRSFTPWLIRAHHTGLHQHPWHYYLRMLLWTHSAPGPTWSEGLIIGLAVVGGLAALFFNPKNRIDSVDRIDSIDRIEGSPAFARFLTFYTLLLTLIYSLIPYKTPWCVLSFLSGMILLAGLGAMTLLQAVPGRIGKAVVGLLLLVGCVQLGVQAYRAGFVYEADTRNPYAYAQPGPDAERLGRRMEELTVAYPAHDQTVIQVISIDNYYWPLPWHLRRFPNIGFYNQVPPDATAPLILASPEFEDELTKKLNDTHVMTGFFSLRSGVFLEVWARMDLWKDYLAHKKATQKEEPD